MARKFHCTELLDTNNTYIKLQFDQDHNDDTPVIDASTNSIINEIKRGYIIHKLATEESFQIKVSEKNAKFIGPFPEPLAEAIITRINGFCSRVKAKGN
jgi:hypothetical protein